MQVSGLQMSFDSALGDYKFAPTSARGPSAFGLDARKWGAATATPHL